MIYNELHSCVLVAFYVLATSFHIQGLNVHNPLLNFNKFQQKHIINSHLQISSEIRLRVPSKLNQILYTSSTSSSSSSSSSSVLLASSSSTTEDDIQRWKSEAIRIKLEAEKMEMELTLQKIKSLETKLNNKSWISKRTADEIQQLEQQMIQLQKKLIIDNNNDPNFGKNVTDNKQGTGTTSKTTSPNPTSTQNLASETVDKVSPSTTRGRSGTSFLFGNRNDDTNSVSSFRESIVSPAKDLLSGVLNSLPLSPLKRNEKANDKSDNSSPTENNIESRQPYKVDGATITPDATGKNSFVIELDPTITDRSTSSRTGRLVEERGLNGFDADDLELFLPVAYEIERTMVNATAEEKLKAFRATDELKTHFQMKISNLLIQPMKDMQELDYLKRQYLTSSSRVEKEQLKNRIDKLTNTIQGSEPAMTGIIYLSTLRPLSDLERQQRIDAVSKLPTVLQTLYLRRCKLDYDETDLELAIELDYYEKQLEILDQITLMSMFIKNTTQYNDLTMAIESLPIKARDFFAKTVGIVPGNAYSTDDVIEALYKSKGDKELIDGLDDGTTTTTDPPSLESIFQDGIVVKTFVQSSPGNTVSPEYNDIGFVDRSRYIEEFYPSIARMEGQHPSLNDIDNFIGTIIDKNNFMVTTKPERVIGGWYIRGRNLINNDQGSGKLLVERLQQSLQSNDKYKNKLQFFYIPDPSPLTDEDFEMEYTSEPLLVITSKQDPATFYKYSTLLTKSGVSFLGLMSVLLVAVGATALQPGIQDRVTSITEAGGNPSDLTFLVDSVTMICAALIQIQLTHELGHRIIAWKDKFPIGFPTLVPSFQLGLLGSITPLNGPPPSLKSLFDFAICGPLFGMVASIGILITGLELTAQIPLSQLSDLPVFPSAILRASELGGSLAEFYLGRGVVTLSESNTLLSLHPLAIAGIAGLFANALALLPLGNTDGGRIAIAMFGRRGAYIVKACTSVLLCVLGLFGFDQTSVFLLYVLFANIWQRDLETPAMNEVEELDFGRGVLGIVTCLFVALALLPMQ